MNLAAQAANHRLRSRVRDYVLYVAIAFTFLGAVFVVEGKWGHEAFIRWGGLTGFTAALFGYFAQESRQYFRERRFWMLTAALLAVHLAAFAIVLTHVEEWKLMWFMVMVFEYPVLLYARSRLPNPSQDGEA
jgi:apolipoprotein N-acyltransferase